MSCPVTAVIAPAGFGKTSALSQVLGELPEAIFIRTPYRASLRHFVKEFSHKCSALIPAMSLLPEDVPHHSAEVTENLLAWTLTHIFGKRLIIAVDDLQYSDDDPAIMDYLVRLIEETTSTVRWIVSSRSRGTLPITRWQAYGLADDPINADFLKLTLEEAFELAQAENSPVTEAQIARWLEQTNGFAVALTYAIRSSARRKSAEGAIDSARNLTFDFLAEQLWSSLPDDDKRLLEILAFMPPIQLKDVDCRTLGCVPSRITELTDDIAFISISVDAGVVMHDLFRDFVHRQMQRAAPEVLSSRREVAVDLLVIARRYEDAAKLLIESESVPKILKFVEEFAAQLSDIEIIQGIIKGVDLCDIAQFGLGMLTLQTEYWGWYGDMPRSQRFANAIIERPEATSRDLAIANFQTFRFINSQDTPAQQRWLSESALLLQRLNDDDRTQAESYRASILARYDGTHGDARQLLESIIRRLPGINPAGRLQVEISLASAFWWMNDRTEALRFARAAVTTVETLKDVREKARALNTLGLMLLSSRSSDVEALFSPLRDLINQTALWRFSHISHWVPANYYALKGNSDAARAGRLIQSEVHLFEESERSRFSSNRRHDANLGHILDEEYEVIIADYLKLGAVPEPDLQYSILIDVAAAHVLIGDFISADQFLREARGIHDKLSSLQITELKESLLIEALCLGACGRWQQAKRLAFADCVSSPRLLLAERALQRFSSGPPFASVDEFAKACESQPFVGLFATVLQRIVKAARINDGASLSLAELIVLRQMGEGQSNKQIAAARNRSAETIKRQVASIFKKLGVENRTQALLVAKSRGIL